MKAAAIGLWVLASICGGFIAVAFFAAAKGDVTTARYELAIGLLGGGGLFLIGWWLW